LEKHTLTPFLESREKLKRTFGLVYVEFR